MLGKLRPSLLRFKLFGRFSISNVSRIRRGIIKIDDVLRLSGMLRKCRSSNILLYCQAMLLFPLEFFLFVLHMSLSNLCKESHKRLFLPKRFDVRLNFHVGLTTWPIQLHFHTIICDSIDCWIALVLSLVFAIEFCHNILNIDLNYLFTKICERKESCHMFNTLLARKYIIFVSS